jgi:hypothetical protein
MNNFDTIGRKNIPHIWFLNVSFNCGGKHLTVNQMNQLKVHVGSGKKLRVVSNSGAVPQKLRIS